MQMEKILMTARDPLGMAWRKSSYSAESHCVEVAREPAGVLVRDSKDLDGPTLSVTAADWRAFLLIVEAITR